MSAKPTPIELDRRHGDDGAVDPGPDREGEGGVRRARVAAALASVPVSMPWRHRRHVPTLEAEEDDGSVRRWRVLSETTPDPVFHANRRVVIGPDEEFEGSTRRYCHRAATSPLYRLPGQNSRRPLIDEDEDFAGLIVRRGAPPRSNAPADYRVLSIRRTAAPPVDDEEEDARDSRVIRRLPQSDEPTPVYSLPRRPIPPNWDLVDDDDFPGSARRVIPPHLPPPTIRRLTRRPVILVEEEDFPGQTRRWCPTRFPSAGGDALRIHLSGALADGGAQTNPALSLGGFRSASEATRVGFHQTNPTSGLEIVFAAGANGGGGGLPRSAAGGAPIAGQVQLDGQGAASYTGPDGTRGPKLALPIGVERVLVDGADPSRWVRVRRTTADPPIGLALVEFVDQFNNMFGFSDAANAESAAGGSRYRAAILRAGEALFAVRIAIGPLAPAAVSSGGGLPLSGAAAVAFADYAIESWPPRGWARIETAGGALKEVVYYAYRDHRSFFVLPSGRGRLGTSARAGAITDIVTPVPGLRIAWEPAAPANNGPVQTISTEATAPIGLTWSTAITPAAGLAIGDLATERQGALWIHRELPQFAFGSPAMEARIILEFVHENTLYREILAGLWRQAYDLHEAYELYVGVDAEPDLAQPPAEIFPSLPFTYPPALANGRTYYFLTQRRNKYDMVTEVLTSTPITVSAGGGYVAPRPAPPEALALAPAASGSVRVTGVYYYEPDGANQADQFALYLTSTGSPPDPTTDAPIAVLDMVKTDGAAKLDWTSGTFADGTPIQVIARTRRSTDGVESLSPPVLAVAAVVTAPASPAAKHFWRARAQGPQ